MVFLAGALSLMGTWLRDLIEQHHTADLKEANTALQAEIAERKRIEQRALELALEREKSQLLRNFIGDISHDLMTPLTIVRSSLYISDRLITQCFAEIVGLRDSNLNDAALASAAETVLRSGETIREQQIRADEGAVRLQNLIQRLLEMVEVDEQVTYDFGPTDLNVLVAARIEPQRSIATQKDLQLNFEPGSQIPLLRLDEIAFSRVIQNLLVNALTYTPRGGTVTVRTYLREQIAVLEVQDTGIGIPAEALPHIFERFYRVDPARAMASGGSGLGLSIAHKIVLVHGGTIEVESRVGAGTTFRVLLPLPGECQPNTPA